MKALLIIPIGAAFMVGVFYLCYYLPAPIGLLVAAMIFLAAMLIG
jgi:hypothetical protein